MEERARRWSGATSTQQAPCFLPRHLGYLEWLEAPNTSDPWAPVGTGVFIVWPGVCVCVRACATFPLSNTSLIHTVETSRRNQ